MSGKTCNNVEWKLFTCHIRITPKEFVKFINKLFIIK